MVNVGKMLVTSHMGDTSAEVMLEIDGYDAYALSKSNSSDSIKRVVLNAIKNDMFKRALREPKYIGTLDWGTRHAVPAIDRVIFHDPATIVYWEDGTKTGSSPLEWYFKVPSGFCVKRPPRPVVSRSCRSK